MSILPGIKHFAEHFSAFSNQYILIGGAACHVWYADEEPAFRATQDMDIVLVLEQLNEDLSELSNCISRQTDTSNGNATI